MNKPTLLILAAGIGSRYGGLKQLDKVGPGGEAIIDYSIYDAIQAGFGKVVFVIRKSIETDFREFIGNKLDGKIEVAYVFQELDKLPEGITPNPDRQKPYGTGHAVLMAADVIKENFAVINADDFYGREAYETIAKYFGELDPNANDNCMVGYNLKNTLSDNGYVSRGQCSSDENAYLIDVVERTHIEKKADGIFFKNEEKEQIKLDENTLVSMNFWGFTPQFFGQLNTRFTKFIQKNKDQLKAEFYIPTAVNEMIEEGIAKTKVLESDAAWFGVTYQEDRPVVVESIRDLIKAGKYPERLF
ncbi:NTP transferase domain-containing protein [Lentimicrobium sp. L6]|uniref:nucleotidyltransferase family protein n=1 Tax=Lentimicrobium sp. L6 TaxID=2735916 RepID=UPI0015563405|nr:sugar phosphate nucleotidyltransferase [Lentimicrobium sp. L6]NPD84855.1 NTP transferase domain-containing protein [Lentimicrobium sp. L6]